MIHKYIFVQSGQKLLVDTQKENGESNEILTFDGEKTTSVRNIQSPYPSVGISNSISRSMFFQPFSPVAMAMLLDVEQYGMLNDNFDLLLFLKNTGGWVYEKTEIVDGVECIILAHLTRQIYLDINRDFSVIQDNFYSTIFEYPSDGVRIMDRFLSSQKKLSNLKNFGNAIWLPQQTEYTYFDKSGKIIERRFIELVSAEINKDIPDTLFTDIVPENAIVFDKSRNMIYKQSDHASIDSLLKETVKSKRVFIYRYISIISGLVLIFIVLVIKYRLYLKAKRERENKTDEETK
jgi:hypothetical protein